MIRDTKHSLKMNSEFKYIGLIERFLNEEMSNWEQEQLNMKNIKKS